MLSGYFYVAHAFKDGDEAEERRLSRARKEDKSYESAGIWICAAE